MKRNVSAWQVVALVILIAGIILTGWSARQQDQAMRDELLIKTAIAKTGIPAGEVAALTGSDADLASPEYLVLKSRLKEIRAADPRIRFVYIIGQKNDGTIILLANSEPPESPDYSPPGQVYTEAPAAIRSVFFTGQSVNEGPYTDRWGTWVSGFIPIADPTTGKVIAVFCMDDDATDWNGAIVRSSSAIIAATFLVLAIIVAFGLAQQRKEREQRLLESSEEKFSKAFDANPALMVISAIEDGRILDVNTGFLSSLGYSRDEVIGRTPSDLGLYADPARRTAILRAIGETGQVRDMEVKLYTKNRALLECSLSSVIINVTGIPRMFTVILDLTERNRAKEALQESEEKYRNLAENTADILFSVDNRGDITYVSPQITIFGYAPDELSGEPFIPLIHPEDRDRVAGSFENMMATGDNIPSQFRIIGKNGAVFWVDERSKILFDANHKPRGLQGVLRDVTDRRKAEDAIRLANRKLNLLNDITRHDIINTITGLLGLVEMARDPSVQGDLETLLSDIRTLVKTIQQQIEFTREYQAVGVREPVWQDLSRLIRNASAPFESSGVKILNDISAIEVFGDPMLEKVFYNLIQNALSYGEHVTSIRFTERISDRGFAIVCEDDGVGIPAAMKEKIFERGIGRHTGMGLFLSREILAITGISIRENGEPGKGARFEIVIPKGCFRIRKG
jgi:PAS domain S-box-containing protein